MEDTRSAGSDCVDWVIGLVNLHVECEHLDGQVDYDRQKCCEKGAKDIVLAAVLGNMDNLGNHVANNVHPCDGASKRETGNNGIKRLTLELKSDT